MPAVDSRNFGRCEHLELAAPGETTPSAGDRNASTYSYRGRSVAIRAPQFSCARQSLQAGEHIYLTWAGVMFVSLTVLAWYINDWTPGQMYVGSLGVSTDVDAIFLALLLLAVFASGGAIRAKIWIERELRKATSDIALKTHSRRWRVAPPFQAD